MFQFYPSSDDQVTMITSAAQKAGFGGGLVVDYPNSTKKRKMYLCLMVGQQEVPKGIDGEEAVLSERRRKGGEAVQNEKRRRAGKAGGKKGKKGKDDNAKDWILKKKDLYRTRGKEGCVQSRTCAAYHISAQRYLHTNATSGCRSIPSTPPERDACSSSVLIFSHLPCNAFHDPHDSLVMLVHGVS